MGATERATPDQTPATLADRLERGRRRAVTRWLWERELYRPTDDPTGPAEVGSD